jgi:hypothetical protein
MLNFSNSL